MNHRSHQQIIGQAFAIFLAVALSSCTATFTAPPAPTELPEALVLATQVVVAGTEAAAAEAATAAQSTSVAAATVTQAAQEEARESSLATRAADQAPIDATATARVDDVYTEMHHLAAEGYLTQWEGGYVLLPDFEQSWAQIDWYRFWFSGYAPDNFVISTDMQWSLASEAANAYNSGCGFIFRADGDAQNYYMVDLALDGSIDFTTRVNDEVVEYDHQYIGPVGFPQGSAHFVMIVEGTTITVFLNGEKVYQRGDGRFSEGNLHYTLVSGTNSGYGMRCSLTNMWLWDLEKQPPSNNDPQGN